MLNYQRVIIQNLGKLGKEECCSVFFWEDFWMFVAIQWLRIAFPARGSPSLQLLGA
jgi:hypothetical protein